MKIVKIETVRVEEFSEFLAVLVHTDSGVTGLGETCFGPEAVSAYIHESVAWRLLGTDPLRIERHAKKLPEFYVTHGGTGVSTRAHSAIDIALWDILGKVSGQPLFQLLGGRYRESAPVYNTCGGYLYGKREAEFRGTSRAISGEEASGGGPAGKRGPYEDLESAQHRPAELAADLLAQGITAMKIWPFDDVARANGGQYISAVDIKRCLEPIERIRAAVGGRMEVMIELHGLWTALPAVAICRALEEYSPYWVEDPVRLENLDALLRLRESTSVRFALGETLGSQPYFKRLFDTGAVDVAMCDFGWGGGLTEARKIASLAEAYGLPVAPHDCVGPVALAVGAHFSVSIANVLIQESVRAYYTDWYQEIVTGLPVIEDGMITPPAAPGIGVELRPDLVSRGDADVRVSS